MKSRDRKDAEIFLGICLLFLILCFMLIVGSCTAYMVKEMWI